MDSSNITPDLHEKAEGKSVSELLELVEEEGIELTDEQLEKVAGGVWDEQTTYIVTHCNTEIPVTDGSRKATCPKCGITIMF